MRIERSNDAANVAQLLVKLARTTVKIFYEPKFLLLIDMLIKEKYVSERRLEKVLRYDIKLLRGTLATLKNDKIIGVVLKIQENSKGGRYWDDCYFVKYENLVNVVKYKLEIVRNQLDCLENRWNTKKSFVCTFCQIQWSDLDAGEILNMETLKFQCPVCRQLVIEDISEIPRDTRLQIAQFNKQTEGLYDFIKQIEEALF